MPSTEFFRSLFRLHPWSTNKFHEFNPCWRRHYATFQHSLLHWYCCEEEWCIYHDKYVSMAPAIFIPPTPSPTNSDESYSFPITTADPMYPPVLDLTFIYFGL